MVSSVFKRHRGLIVFLGGVIAVFILLYVLRSAIIPFAVGLAMAYIFSPVVSWLENKLPYPGRWQGFKRVTIIILLFVLLLAVFTALVFVFMSAVVNAFSQLIQAGPGLISDSLSNFRIWLVGISADFAPEFQTQIEAFLLDAGESIGRALQGVVVSGVSAVPDTLSFMLGFAALPLFLFYLLKDVEKVRRGFYASFTPWLGVHVRNIVSIIERVLGRYLRAQLMLGTIVAYLTYVGLLLLGISVAPALAIMAGITEIIPTIGPWIGGIFAVIVTLALAPDKVIWVAVLFLGVQLLENNLLVPRIQGGYLHIHPAAAIVLLVLGAYVAGIWGMLFAVPLAATVIAIYRYVRQAMQTDSVVAGTVAEKGAEESAG
jgi:predicted PurR-regulated permease PerM